MAVLLLLSGFTPAPAPAAPLHCFEISPAEESRASALLVIELTLEAGARSIVCADGSARTAPELGLQLRAGGVQAGRAWAAVERSRLVVVRGARGDRVGTLGRVLALAGRRAVVELAPERALEDPWSSFHAAECGAESAQRLAEVAEPVVGERVVLARRLRRGDRAAASGPVTPALERAVGRVDRDRWFAAVEALAGWNRWTRGSQILLARDWLVARFGELAGMEVWTESFPVTTSTGWNVFARLPGTADPSTWVLVGGHYDSTSQSPQTAAPGAEDNASGCAGVLELARAFAATPPPFSILFVCYSGEEQGLHGSNDHAADLVASGGTAGLAGVLIYDMIGYSADAELDVLLETSLLGEDLVELFAVAAADFTGLEVDISWNPFGSDHMPYLNRGIPALLAIENDWDIYPHYHRTTDVPAHLSLAMGEGILRMGAAGLGRLAGLAAPPGLLARDGFERGDLSAWSEAVLEP